VCVCVTSCPVCRYVQTPVPTGDNKCFECSTQLVRKSAHAGGYLCIAGLHLYVRKLTNYYFIVYCYCFLYVFLILSASINVVKNPCLIDWCVVISVLIHWVGNQAQILLLRLCRSSEDADCNYYCPWQYRYRGIKTYKTGTGTWKLSRYDTA